MITINANNSYLIGNRTLNSGGGEEEVIEEENPVTQIEKTEPELNVSEEDQELISSELKKFYEYIG